MKGFLSSGTNLPEKSLFGVFTGHWFFLRDCSSLYRCSWNSLYTGSGEKQFLSWLEQSAVRMSKISGFGATELSEQEKILNWEGPIRIIKIPQVPVLLSPGVALFLCPCLENTCFSFQTVVLGILMRSIGNKNTILLGLGFQILQLAWYGFGSQPW